MDADESTRRTVDPKVLVVLALVAAVVAALAVWRWVADSDSSDDTAITSSSTASSTTSAAATSLSTSSTSTTGSAAASTTTTATPIDASSAVWPWASSATRYSDPVAAARGFAVEYVGFTDPVLGEFMQGDSRSGEVEVRPVASGPVTTVFVRQLGADDSWWVLGAATANIEVDRPSALQVIASPVTLAGRADAFEGNVNVTLRVDGSDRPIVEHYVTGMMGELGPFNSDLAFPAQAAGARGAVVFRTLSAEDGSVWEAGVVRVSFGG